MSISQEWIIFDFDGVIAHREIDRSKLVGQALGLDPRLCRRFYDNGYLYTKILNEISQSVYTIDQEVKLYEKIFEALAKAQDSSATQRQIQQLSREFVEVKFVLYPNAIESLAEISTRYKIAMITDAFMSRRDNELTYLGLIDFFEFILISGEEKMDKSSLGIYHKAINLSGSAADMLRLVEDRTPPLKLSLEAGFSKGYLVGRGSSDDWHSIESIGELARELFI